MMYADEMGSGAMIDLVCFVKIWSGIQKLLERLHWRFEAVTQCCVQNRTRRV
jgi:hypothetical protein